VNMHTAMTTGELLAAHQSRTDLIRQYANEAEPAVFAKKWTAILERCAVWFSSMPLRPEEHAEPGGAFRAMVEVAYFAMRLSGGQKFGADKPSEQRRRLEPQYLYALFLAACCSRLDEPCRHFQFHRAVDDAEWLPALHGAFGPWLGDGGYRVTRRAAALPVERMRTALLAREILGQDILASLDSEVLSELFAAINPEPRPVTLESLLHKVVRLAVDATTSFELKARRADFAPVGTPAPPADLLAVGSLPQESVKAVPADTPPHAVVPPTESAAASVISLFAAAGAKGTPASEASDATPQQDHPSPQEVPRSAQPMQLGSGRSLRRGSDESAAPEGLADVLGNASNLMREFFLALAQDVTAGKVPVTWAGNRLVLPKRALGNYGLSSDTLIESLKKLSFLARVQGTDLVLTEKISGVLASRPPVQEP